MIRARLAVAPVRQLRQSGLMTTEPPEVERWHHGGRYYLTHLASTPTSMDLELDDVGPGIGRGPIALASCDDATGELVVRVFTDAPLPLGLLELLLSEARTVLPAGS